MSGRRRGFTPAELARAGCDVCGRPGRVLLPEDRMMYPYVAAWVCVACDECMRRFQRRQWRRPAA